MHFPAIPWIAPDFVYCKNVFKYHDIIFLSYCTPLIAVSTFFLFINLQAVTLFSYFKWTAQNRIYKSCNSAIPFLATVTIKKKGRKTKGSIRNRCPRQPSKGYCNHNGCGITWSLMTSTKAIQYACVHVIAWPAAVPERGFNPHNHVEALTMME